MFNDGGVTNDVVIWWFKSQSLVDMSSVRCINPSSTPHSEDVRNTSRNMLVSLLWIKYIININEHLLVIYIILYMYAFIPIYIWSPEVLLNQILSLKFFCIFVYRRKIFSECVSYTKQFCHRHSVTYLSRFQVSARKVASLSCLSLQGDYRKIFKNICKYHCALDWYVNVKMTSHYAGNKVYIRQWRYSSTISQLAAIEMTSGSSHIPAT